MLVASGRVDFDHLVARAEELCGHWPKGEPGRNHEDAVFTPGELEVDLPDTQQRYIMLMSPSIGIDNPAKYAVAQAFRALGDTEGSTFFWELVETGLAEEATMHLQTHDGCGEAIATLVCASENAEQVEAIARREMSPARGHRRRGRLGAEAAPRSPPPRCWPASARWAA